MIGTNTQTLLSINTCTAFFVTSSAKRMITTLIYLGLASESCILSYTIESSTKLLIFYLFLCCSIITNQAINYQT